MENYLIDETEFEDEMALCELEDESLPYDWEDEI